MVFQLIRRKAYVHITAKVVPLKHAKIRSIWLFKTTCSQCLMHEPCSSQPDLAWVSVLATAEQNLRETASWRNVSLRKQQLRQINDVKLWWTVYFVIICTECSHHFRYLFVMPFIPSPLKLWFWTSLPVGILGTQQSSYYCCFQEQLQFTWGPGCSIMLLDVELLLNPAHISGVQTKVGFFFLHFPFLHKQITLRK